MPKASYIQISYSCIAPHGSLRANANRIVPPLEDSQLDLLQLEAFLAVAEERSFSRAAARIHRTQPAVSQIVAKLEAELGETLLDRSSRDGSLTDAGTVLLDYAHKMLNLREDASAALVELRSLHQGRLNLAANEYTCLCLLPLLDAFRKEHPKIKVAVQRSLASRIADDVLSHSVEIGIVGFKPEDRNVQAVTIFRDQLVCIVSPQHALAKAGKASIQRLGRESFIAHNVPSPLRHRVIEAFKRHRTPLRMDVELPSLEAIKRFVQLGNGVALLPRLTAEVEVATGTLRLVEVPELQMERKLRLIHRRSAPLSHAGRAFLAIAEKYAGLHGDPFCFIHAAGTRPARETKARN